ncbi:MAG: hypothetical protein WD491_07305 [Balneolales bacterium]
MRRIGLLTFIIFITVTGSLAQVNVGQNGSLSGLVYNDYYWVVSNHHEALKGSHGFWFRRIYFGYNHNHSGSFSSRLRFEMSNDGDFTTMGNMTPFVKDAWLKWENENHEIFAGISSTPTFDLVENIWDFRAVEKTPLDLHQLASSRDFGLAARGVLDENEQWSYHVMIGNGNNDGTFNKVRKIMLALSYQLNEHWVLQAYGDWENIADDRDWMTVQGFMGYKTDNLAFGALYALQNRENPITEDMNLDLASAFVRGGLTPLTTGFFRVDHMFTPNPDGENIDFLPFSDEAESTFFIAGVDFQLEDGINLIPNIEGIIYGETSAGITPRTDLIPRLTLFYSF